MAYKFMTANNKILKRGKKFPYFDPDVFEWYAMTEDDLNWSYNAYHRAAFVNGINTSEPNIIVPSTLDGYQIYWNMTTLPNTVVRLKFADMPQMKGSFVVNGTSANPNTTLRAIYNIPPLAGQFRVQYCSALEEMDLSAMTTATDILIGYNNSLRMIPALNRDFTGSASNLRNKLWHNAMASNKSYAIPAQFANIENALSYNNISQFTIDPTWDNIANAGGAITNNPLTDVYYSSNVATQEKAWTVGGNSIDGSTWFDSIATTRSGNILHYSAYTAAPVTIHCNYGSAIYHKLRYAQSTQNYMMRNLRLHLMDNHPIKQISFWGDSLTRRNENTSIQSNMVEHFYNWTSDDVWCWNEGHGGAGTASYVRDYTSQEARWTDDVHVIWLGTNDTILTEQQTIDNIQSMITAMGVMGKVIVLQPFGWGYAVGNETLYEQAFPGITINTHKYIIDHGFDVLGREPTNEEREQLNNDTIPDVFVDTSDMTHITDSGGLVIATAIKEKLLSLGYVDNTWFT